MSEEREAVITDSERGPDDDHAWLPASYWAFIEQQGAVRRGGLSFYEAPTNLAGLGLVEGPPGFLAICDDGAGCFFGFEPTHGERLMAVDSMDLTLADEAPTFTEFIDAWLT